MLYHPAEGLYGRLREELFLRLPVDCIFTVHDLLWSDETRGSLFEHYRARSEGLAGWLKYEMDSGLLACVNATKPRRFMLSTKGQEARTAFYQHLKIKREAPRLALVRKVNMLDRARIAYNGLSGPSFWLDDPFAQHIAGFTNGSSMRAWLYRLQGVCFSLKPKYGDIKVTWLPRAHDIVHIPYVHPESHRARDGRLGGLFVNRYNLYRLGCIAYELRDPVSWWVAGETLIRTVQERFGLSDKISRDIGSTLKHACYGKNAVLERMAYWQRLTRKKSSDTQVVRANYRITALGLCFTFHSEELETLEQVKQCVPEWSVWRPMREC